ncbi:uncharacterized protein pre-mod(mdg4)-AE, partial [Drosophila montana]|uniref:uncharacterized protein pre-mod(mdg4)-AE n=1 Tax=Drosophila montana TaxID=40370 RepID=UPI00313BF978
FKNICLFCALPAASSSPRRRRITYRRRAGCLLIDGFRFVISYQQRKRCYLKCSNFRSQCRARAIQNKETGQVQLRNGVHNHIRGQKMAAHKATN